MLNTAIIAAYVIMALLVLYFQVTDFLKAKKEGRLETETSYTKTGAVGFFCLFFDVLGIGCFSTITFLLTAFHLVPDKKIPGTLNVSTALSAPIFALLFFAKTDVDPVTLIILTACAAVGAYFGAKLVSGMPEIKVQFSMGIAMLIAAFFVLLGQLNLMPVGGDALGLTGMKLVIAAVTLLVVGALANLGVGPWAPTMAILFFLGISPIVCYPICYALSAFQQPISSIKFIQEDAYDRKASAAITVCGCISATIAFFIAVSLPTYVLKWIVFFIVLYTGLRMFYAYRKSKKAAATAV